MQINHTFILTIWLSCVAFIACDKSNVTETTEHPDEEDIDIFDIITKENKRKPSTVAGVMADASKSLYQGDIMLDESPDDVLHEMGRKSNEGSFGVLIWPRKVWRTRVLPYVIAGHTQDAVQKIKAAMRDLERIVCVKFRPKESADKKWLHIYRGSGCWAGIGMSFSAETKVNLASYCVKSNGLIIHELMHAMGFFHEQARRDRDSFVRIVKNNIQPSQLYNFDKVDSFSSETFGVPYDFQSVMHYTKTTFNRNGENTIEAVSDPNKQLGGVTLTKNDIKKLNAMYHCKEKSVQGWTEWSSWSQCMSTYLGCYRSKYRICFGENLSACPGADETGVGYNTEKCASPEECKKEKYDGSWGEWTRWNSCSTSCDKGTRKRSRNCDSPRPTNGGRDCIGSASDIGKCILKPCRQNKYISNFDNGFGVWTNVNSYKDPLLWKKGRGQASTTSGPTEDHTDGKGWYLFVSTKNLADHHKKATLASENISGFKCFSFAYCMNGKHMGHLTFYVIQSDGKLVDYNFNKNGHQGKDWNRVEVSLDNPNYKKFTYKIFIEAKTGLAPYSNIAIDDVWIEDGTCQSPEKPIEFACKDTSKMCARWAKRGECFTNSEYMHKYCCLSCKDKGLCDKDNFDVLKCNRWVGQGECMKNSDWMWKNCCKSCQTVQGTCDSKGILCGSWARIGFCDLSITERWMWTNCCAACDKVWHDKSKTCVDKSSRCKEWAGNGECKSNPHWMLVNCCKSCKDVEKQ